MDIFNLPITARVNRVIPKNSFDQFTSPAQRREFTEFIQKITWVYKLSADTINLTGENISEIQFFRVELKAQKVIDHLLGIIDKSIPYTIVFAVEYDGKAYLLTSVKHSNPLDENKSVIDWTVKTDWFLIGERRFSFSLKKNLDEVYLDICIQLNGRTDSTGRTMTELVEVGREVDALKKQITKLRSAIAACKQFNQKVEMNIKLQNLEIRLRSLL